MCSEIETEDSAPGEAAPEEAPLPDDRFTVSIPADRLSPDALARLRKLIVSRHRLFCDALNAAELPVEEQDGKIAFPWFEQTEDEEERAAYTLFIERLAELSFVGISEPFTVAVGDEAPHDLTVLIPKSDYDRALLKSRLEAAGVLMLLLFFAVSCCLFYTRRYLRPILRDIERLKDESGGAQMTFDELQPVSARLRSHEQTITVLETEKLDLQGQVEHMQSQVVDTQEQLDDSLAEIRRLAYLGKKELDPADYQKFLEGYAKLSSKELEICAALAKGLSARQCAEQTGNALSTIDTYRKRVYEKTNIHRVRQLRLCYALMQLEQAEQDK